MVDQAQSAPLPAWAAPFLAASAAARVEAAVRAAERGTSGEIVPMVVRRSAVTGHVFTVLLLGLAALYFALDAANLLGRVHGAQAGWVVVHLLVLTGVAWGLSRWPAVQRLVTPGADLEAQVMRRAAVEFYEAGLDKTAGATGILLFVSLAERRAVVLVDKGIGARLPSTTWAGVVGRLVEGIRQADLGLGLVDAIAECGRLAAVEFPAAADGPDELSDALVVKS